VNPPFNCALEIPLTCKLVFCRCKANNTAVLDTAAAGKCQMSSRPCLVLMELQIITYFCAGIATSSWVWQKSTVKAWKRYLKRLFVLQYLL